MADYLALQAELALPEYAGLDDDQAATHFNAKTIAIREPNLAIPVVLSWAGMGPIDAIDAAQEFAHPDPATQKAVRAACKAAMRLFNGAIGTFNVDSAANIAGVGVFVAAGLISPAEAASLSALANATAPHYAQPGQFGAPAGPADIAHARKL